jgi:hypothetical protein
VAGRFTLRYRIRVPPIPTAMLRSPAPSLALALALLPVPQPAALAQQAAAPPQRSEMAAKGGEPKFWPEAPDQAEVIAATFLGGKNTEWLSAGGFQPDGTVVLAGTSLGPELALPIRETVLGKDLPPPPPYTPVPKMDRGKPKLDKAGQPVFERPGWTHPNATGFVARLSPDLKKVLSVSRLPWTSGAITAMVVDPKDGSITIAGRATDGIGGLSADSQAMQIPAEATRKDATCDQTFVARLSPDATRALWVRTARGPSDAPRLQYRADGNVMFGSQDLRALDAAGKVVSSVLVPGGVRETTSVNPVDGTIVRGGEHHWGTGREPWRCPILNVHEPDGKLRYQFYDWGGPYVGLDNCRQVSDSAVRLVSHDRAGNILFVAWSDGGNSVMGSQPFDLRRSAGFNGMGLNSAGAGVTSFCYIVRLDPKTYEVNGYSFWCSKYGGKANGIGISTLALADDGAVCAAGGSAWGIIQTKNRISAPDSEPGGSYIAVFSGDLNRARFVSTLPGAGATDLTDTSPWGIGIGSQGGQARALFLSGATKDGDPYGVVTPTPVRNALQPNFGGGESDGHVVLVDLSKGTPPPSKANVTTPSRLTYHRDARRNDPKKPEAIPPDGASFWFSSTTPKYVTVDAEFRDSNNALWPSFLCGKPVDGTAGWKAGALTANVTVECSMWTQPNGLQDRRTLHGLIAEGTPPPPLRFRLDALTPPKVEDVRHTDSGGKESVRTVTSAEGRGVLEVGGRTLTVKPRVTWTYQAGARDGTRTGIRMTAWFTFKGSELGLPGKAGASEIDARISWTGQEGTPPAPGAPANAKKE